MITAISKSFVGGRNYLNTTNYGLFPSVAIDQMQRAAQALGEGSFDTETRDAALESSRKYFAQLVGVDSPSVAIGSSVSPFVGLVANSLPVRSTVLLVEDDFTSLTLPFVIQRDRLNVVAVPLDKFVDAIDDSIDIAVVSAVQSADGAIVDVDALAQKRNDRNVKIILDATQATGWLPI
ncbi:MAG: hypothetical protein ACRER3_20915, partial [Pseudomonas fluorescens]